MLRGFVGSMFVTAFAANDYVFRVCEYADSNCSGNGSCQNFADVKSSSALSNWNVTLFNVAPLNCSSSDVIHSVTWSDSKPEVSINAYTSSGKLQAVNSSDHYKVSEDMNGCVNYGANLSFDAFSKVMHVGSDCSSTITTEVYPSSLLDSGLNRFMTNTTVHAYREVLTVCSVVETVASCKASGSSYTTIQRLNVNDIITTTTSTTTTTTTTTTEPTTITTTTEPTPTTTTTTTEPTTTTTTTEPTTTTTTTTTTEPTTTTTTTTTTEPTTTTTTTTTTEPTSTTTTTTTMEPADKGETSTTTKQATVTTTTTQPRVRPPVVTSTTTKQYNPIQNNTTTTSTTTQPPMTTSTTTPHGIVASKPGDTEDWRNANQASSSQSVATVGVLCMSIASIFFF